MNYNMIINWISMSINVVLITTLIIWIKELKTNTKGLEEKNKSDCMYIEKIKELLGIVKKDNDEFKKRLQLHHNAIETIIRDIGEIKEAHLHNSSFKKERKL
jgi:hypothetical protein